MFMFLRVYTQDFIPSSEEPVSRFVMLWMSFKALYVLFCRSFGTFIYFLQTFLQVVTVLIGILNNLGPMNCIYTFRRHFTLDFSCVDCSLMRRRSLWSASFLLWLTNIITFACTTVFSETSFVTFCCNIYCRFIFGPKFFIPLCIQCSSFVFCTSGQYSIWSPSVRVLQFMVLFNMMTWTFLLWTSILSLFLIVN